ncbi:MAG: hypothetical protein RLZZ522_1772 [Verrucomicrobiota bacterium]
MKSLLLIVAILLPPLASAQWVEESYPLKAGWSGIWLSQDCSIFANGDTRSIGTVLENYPKITEVWRWNPLGSTVQFTQAPGLPIRPDSSWAVWRRGDPANSTLGTLTGNSAYLINVAPGTAAFSLELKGKPLAPDYSFSSSGLNFIGFPVQTPDSATTRNFDAFFSFSAALKSNPNVVYYNGGALSDVNPKNPLLLSTPRFTAVSRGKAYWVKSGVFSDYYGPLKVTVLGSGGIDLGKKLRTATVRIKNVTDPLKKQTITATLSLAPSLAAPGETGLAPPVALRLRGARDANLQFTYTNLPNSDPPITVSLAPGEEKELVFDADRTQMSTPDASYQSILRVTDSLGHTRIDLPVSAIGTTKAGVWIGAAVLDSVNRVETISGPETDAPVGTPNGADTQPDSTVSTTSTTTPAGQTTTARTFNVAFTSGDAYLDTAGLTSANVIVTGLVTGLNGAPTYIIGTDYTLGPSTRATVTHGGSGYTAAPSVKLTGGGGSAATATATLSAGVRSVIIDSGGTGYSTAPTVSFTDGGGAGATGFAIVRDGLVADVTVTHGGSGYSTPPTINFTGGGGSGAAATAKIVGSVGSVTIASGGSAYTAAPVITFEGGNGSGAAATAQRSSGGTVTGGDAIRKGPSAAIGASAKVTITTVSSAPAGTPPGATTSTVTSTSRLVTLNGKSHLSTKRVSTGGGAAAPSLFPVRLILHAKASGAPTLLQQVYLGERNGTPYAGPGEGPITAAVTGPLTGTNGKPIPAGKVARVSTASFPRGDETWTGLGTLGSTASFTVTLGHNAATNPFLHTYHPDHDNWDARYETPLLKGKESYEVKRTITLNFSPTLPAGISDLDWGVTTLGGTYTETITGLRSQEIAISGSFILHQVSEVPTLTLSNP